MLNEQLDCGETLDYEEIDAMIACGNEASNVDDAGTDTWILDSIRSFSYAEMLAEPNPGSHVVSKPMPKNEPVAGVQSNSYASWTQKELDWLKEHELKHFNGKTKRDWDQTAQLFAAACGRSRNVQSIRKRTEIIREELGLCKHNMWPSNQVAWLQEFMQGKKLDGCTLQRAAQEFENTFDFKGSEISIKRAFQRQCCQVACGNRMWSINETNWLHKHVQGWEHVLGWTKLNQHNLKIASKAFETKFLYSRNLDSFRKKILRMNVIWKFQFC
jgi:hypothetical protein